MAAASATPTHHVRPMTSSDVSQCLQLFANNGLAETLTGLETFRRIDPEGYFVAVDDSGQVLAMCGGSKFDEKSAYIGFYATRPELHGRGIGIKVWRQVMAYIGDMNCGLCAAPAQIPVYRNKAGFVHSDPHMMLCFEGQSVDYSTLTAECEPGSEVIAIKDDNVTKILEYDRSLIGFDRKQLLELSFDEIDAISLAFVDELTGEVKGYGQIKPTNVKQAMLGPLYADNQLIAEVLLKELLNKCPNVQTRGVIMMVLDNNQSAVELATRIGLTCDSGHPPSPRLFTRLVPPSPDVTRIYAIFSPDFSAY